MVVGQDSWLLAVDFGTTTTTAFVGRLNGEPSRGQSVEPVRFGDDTRLASAVMASDDGKLLVGPQIPRSDLLGSARVEPTPKARLGRAVPLSDRMFDGVDLAAAVLAYVADEAGQPFNGTEPAVAVLTHPVEWEQTRQQRLREAGAKAGLHAVELVQEPVAAALALVEKGALDQVRDGDLVAIYDFGGGTFDIALLQRAGGSFEVHGEPGGDPVLGGENVDDDVVTYLRRQLPDSDRVAGSCGPRHEQPRSGWRGPRAPSSPCTPPSASRP
jgi:molecular chaperone DnaK